MIGECVSGNDGCLLDLALTLSAHRGYYSNGSNAPRRISRCSRCVRELDFERTRHVVQSWSIATAFGYLGQRMTEEKIGEEYKKGEDQE